MKPGLGRLKTRREFLRVAAARRKRVMPGLILQAARRRAAQTPLAGQAPLAPDAGQGKVARTESATESHVPDSRDAIRVGFTASRKVGKAVARNRARRRLRAAAAEVIPNLGRPGYDYVLIARKATLDRPYTDLVADLCRALGDLGKGEKDRRPGKPRRPADRQRVDRQRAGRQAAEDRG